MSGNLPEFKRGDTVVLKSDPGNRMAVQQINADGEVKCVWFDLNRGLARGDFSADMLVLAADLADIAADMVKAGQLKDRCDLLERNVKEAERVISEERDTLHNTLELLSHYHCRSKNMEDLLSLLKELHGLPVHIDINSRPGQRPQHVILHSLTKEVLWSEYVEEEKAKNNRGVTGE